jgi:CheY-like chemotaxis protein
MPTVLIADDDLDLLPILSEALTEEGWTVLSAASGVSALAVARSSPIDVILADVVMEDMSGPALEAAFKLDPALEGIPFIFMSAAMAELRELPSALVLRKLLRPL